MIIFSVYNFRHTKRGYRYAPWQVLGSSLVLSLIGGIIFHMIGVGFNFDKWLGVSVSGYESQEKMEQRLWQDPASGRLIGVFAGNDTNFPFSAVFVDVNGVKWRMNTVDLHEEEIIELESGRSVRMFGQVISEDSNYYFHTCGVIPNIYGSDYAEHEIVEYRNMIKSHLSRFYSSDYAEFNNDSLCIKIAPILRFKNQFID